MTRPGSVGIVIATYNRPILVLEGVTSVLAQEPPPAQVVVVDDGSPFPQDPGLLALASSGRIHLIQEPNRGVAGALNRGAAEITAEFLLILGDDDCLAPGAIAGLQAALLDRPDAVAAVGGGRRVFRPAGRIGELEWPPVSRGDFAELLGGNPYFVGAVMMRRDAFVAVGGFEEAKPLVEDWDLWLKLSRRGPFVFPRIDALRYGVHTDNMSNTSGTVSRTLSLAEHYLRRFTPAERREYGPRLASYVIRMYGSAQLWHTRIALRRARFVTATRNLGIVGRLIRLGLRFPESRAELQSAWHEHLHSG